MYRYVLFDLDGTLTDPKEGICKSVQYALIAQHIEEPDLDKLEPFIGPPLADSFREFYGMNEEQVKQAVAKFRERFETVGIYENELYPGMDRFLAGLQKKGVHLAVASSKPREFVEKVLTHFGIRRYFEVVAGSEKDGRKVEKTDVMREALGKLFSIPEEEVEKGLAADVLMVGDRKFDVLGAKAFSIDSAAVSYGYAPDGELEEAGADYITDNLEELWTIITGERAPGGGAYGQRAEKVPALQKSLRILSPIVYDYVLTLVVVLVLSWGFRLLTGGVRAEGTPLQNSLFADYSEAISAIFQAVASLAGIVLFSRMYRKEKYQPISHVVKRRNDRRLLKQSGFLAGLSVCLALFLNMAISYLNLSSVSDSYEKAANIQYSLPLAAGLIVYGIIAPIEEELVFRGLVYGRMRKYFPAAAAIPVSALLFGAYHGNLVQLIYAFCMGCLLAWAFERYKDIKASVLVHAAANLAVYTVSSVPAIRQSVFSPRGFAVTGILTVVFAACLVCQNILKIKYK